MFIRYIRFDKAVGSPGHAGANITKAFARVPKDANTPRDERMDEIEVIGHVVALRAVRKTDKGVEYLAERFTPLTNVVDFELMPEPAPEQPKKGNAR